MNTENGGDMGESMLIIEDDDTFSATLVRALKRRGYVVVAARSVEACASRRPKRMRRAEWCWISISMGRSGLNLIPRLMELNPACRIVVLTGYASITTAVDAIKLGAVQYLAKPVDISTLLRAFGHELHAGESRVATPALPPPFPRYRCRSIAWNGNTSSASCASKRATSPPRRGRSTCTAAPCSASC
jgi:ActR/RegA family two-component response regulator